MIRKKVASTIAPVTRKCEKCGADVQINPNEKNQKCICGAEIHAE